MDSSPRVSVVIPVRNGAAGLERAVRSALAQGYPLEVVIAIGPSEDGTETLARGLAATDERVRIVPNPSGETAAGLNAAIAAAGGDVIVRCDAFAVLPPGYIASAIRILDETGAANVGGLQHAVGINAFERAIAMAVSGRIGAGDARYRVGGEAGPVDTVYLGVFRRDALGRVGGFDERFVRSQDAELNMRLVRAGEVVWFDPRLRVQYRPRGSVSLLWRQYFEYGWWRRQVSRLHRRSLQLRQLIPPLFVLGMIASLLVLPFSLPAAVVVPGLYLAVMVGATTTALVRCGDVAALLLPVVYLTLHLAWGIGFLVAPRGPD